jgi:hypothetical protein
MNELSITFADTFAPDGGYFFSGRKFDHHQRSGRGAIAAWNILKKPDDSGDRHFLKKPDDSGDRHFLEEKIYDVWFCLPSKFLGACDSSFMLKRFFLDFLLKWNVKMSRIDVACDDYSKSLHPSVLKTAVESRLNHGFRKWKQIDGDDGGYTFYAGNRSSDKFSRFYDKSVESDGLIDAYRFETIFKDGYAQSLWKEVVTWLSIGSNPEDCLRELLCSASLNSIDFYSLSNPDNKNSEKLYEQWWLDFKALFNTSQLKVRMDRIKTTIDKTCEWIELQVETSLAMIENFYNRTSQDFAEWINARLESGRERLTNFHLNKVSSQICYNDAMDGFF